MSHRSANKPAPAFTLRRAKTIVDILALHPSKHQDGFDSIATGWGVDIIGCDFQETVHRLAQHAQEYSSTQLRLHNITSR